MKIRRRPRPDGSLSEDWYVDYTLHRQRRRIRVGPSKRQAEEVLAEIRRRIARGELGDLLPETRKRVRKTFREFKEDYEEKTQAAYRSSTRDRNTSRFTMLLEFFGDYRLDQIDTALIEAYRARRAKGGSSPATINRDFAVLRRMLNVAADWGELPRRPDLRVRALREAPHDFVPPTVEQIEKLLAECEGELHDVVLLALHTGMRRGEIFHLLWKDVDLDGRRVRVVSRQTHMTKANRSRVIPLHDRVVVMLQSRERGKPDSLVFPGRRGKPLTNIQTSWENARKRAELPHLRFHDLRHVFASYLVMKGEPLLLVQALLGHKSLDMVQRYSHLLPNLDRAAVDRLDFGGTASEGTPSYGANDASIKRTRAIRKLGPRAA